MEVMISQLLNRFERGGLTRRELVQGLTMLTAAGATLSDARGEDGGIKVARIDHVSIQVSDLPRSLPPPVTYPVTSRNATERRPRTARCASASSPAMIWCRSWMNCLRRGTP